MRLLFVHISRRSRSPRRDTPVRAAGQGDYASGGGEHRSAPIRSGDVFVGPRGLRPLRICRLEIPVFTHRLGLALALSCVLLFAPRAAAAQSSAPAAEPSAAASVAPTPTPAPERFSIHAQATVTQQYHGAFPAAYSGPQSLNPNPDTAKTADGTLYLGARLWRGGEGYIDPEIDQGFGLGNPAPPGQAYNGTFGVAGFVSGEAYKVGRDSSYGRIQRIFIRQIVNLGGEKQTVDPDENQLGESIDTKHLTLTAGKFSVVDVFDTNPYAHDTKHDFLNWSIIDMGAFDYAADSWGYTYGASAELVNPHTAVRAGLFQLSAQPNGIEVEHQPLRQYSAVLEVEQDTSFFGGHPGAMKALVYEDDGYMGTYGDALALAQQTDSLPNTGNVRQNKHPKAGGGLNLSQEIATDIGVFARVSAMNGAYEAYDFTEIDRSISGGLSINGKLYHRPNDAIGIAGVANALSAPAQAYFAAGGVGVLIGDGAQTYGGEHVIESYYRAGFGEHAGITFDFQRVFNPAYNVVRGPVSVFGLRYHLDY
jgi:high affinity Mn2+ porin